MFDLIKDDSFEVAKTKNYILSIQVCLDGFSFLIVDTDEKKIVASKSSPLKISNDNLLARHLKEWLESEELLKNQFKGVRIFIYTENFTLVPEEFFGRENHRTLSSVLFDKKVNNHFVENKIEKLNVTLFFAISQDISSVLNQFFNKGFEIFHPVTNLIQAPVERKKRNLSFILSIKNYFYLVVFGTNKLILANCFQTPHPHDLVYNVVNTFQQLGISRSESELFIAGAINQNTDFENLLKPYFDNISILKTEEIIAIQVSDVHI